MLIVSYSLGVLYLLIVFVLAMYGFHNLANAILYINSKSTPIKKRRIPPISEYPKVTIQLPIFNEKYTIERLLRSVTRLDYPSDCLQIQVLDDSTDNTATLTKQLVEEYKSRGVNIEWIHRVDRTASQSLSNRPPPRPAQCCTTHGLSHCWSLWKGISKFIGRSL